MCDWIKWEDKTPEEGEAGWVIFRNMITGNYWVQMGTIVSHPFWYDNEPIAWQPQPELPEFIKNKK